MQAYFLPSLPLGLKNKERASFILALNYLESILIPMPHEFSILDHL
jgi:hypothetical protein